MPDPTYSFEFVKNPKSFLSATYLSYKNSYIMLSISSSFCEKENPLNGNIHNKSSSYLIDRKYFSSIKYVS